MRPHRTAGYEQAPLDELLAILLRQFRRPFAAHGIDLNDAEAAQLASAVVRREPLSERAQAIRDVLRELVSESEGVLTRWNLTFEQSLTTEMSAIPGWTTTAEFLDLANEKSNAELRIATGSALLAALGDYRYTHHLLSLVEYSGLDADLDAVIARRVLLFASGVASDDPMWLRKLRRWVEERTTAH